MYWFWAMLIAGFSGLKAHGQSTEMQVTHSEFVFDITIKFKPIGSFNNGSLLCEKLDQYGSDLSLITYTPDFKQQHQIQWKSGVDAKYSFSRLWKDQVIVFSEDYRKGMRNIYISKYSDMLVPLVLDSLVAQVPGKFYVQSNVWGTYASIRTLQVVS